MPSKKKASIFYFVISPKEEHYQDCSDALMSLRPHFQDFLIIKEMGKNGDHAHLNVVVGLKKAIQINNLKRRILAKLERGVLFDGITRGRPFYVQRSVGDRSSLLRVINYITKETEYELIVDEFEEGLDKLILEAVPEYKKWQESKQLTKRPKQVAKAIFVDIVGQYMDELGLDRQSKDDFITALIAVREKYETFYLRPDEVRAIYAHVCGDRGLRKRYEEALGIF